MTIENAHSIGGRWPISSTLRWGCDPFYDGTASARVVGHFYPYGQEKPSATQNGTEKFTGYLRDAETGMDYADQRYHVPGTGRFLTADKYLAGSGPGDPGSWNRYAYVGGDPINRIDPTGRDWCDPDDLDDDCFDDPYGNIGDQIEQQIQQALAGLTTSLAGLSAQIQTAAQSWPTTLSNELTGLEQSGLVTGFDEGSDGSLSSLNLSNVGFADLIQNGYSLSFTSATAGTIAIGGETIGWSITGLGQFILTGLNVVGGIILAATLEQPGGGRDELCWEQYQADVAVCRALKSAACYDQASQRYAACLRGKPLPPFPYRMPRPNLPRRRPQ